MLNLGHGYLSGLFRELAAIMVLLLFCGARVRAGTRYGAG